MKGVVHSVVRDSQFLGNFSRGKAFISQKNNSHIRDVTKLAFSYLRNIATVGRFLSDTERLIHAFITSRLGYFNALLSVLPKKAIGQLQNIQIAAALVLTKSRWRAQLTPV